MSIIDHILAPLAPYECLSCTTEGNLLCNVCIQQLTAVPSRCYRCYKPSTDGLICLACRRTSPLDQLQAGALYSGVAKDLIWKLKSCGARAAAGRMAVCLSPFLSQADYSVITPVPTATGRVRGRGYDQAKLLARELSRRSYLRYGDHLRRVGHTRQVGTSRHRRRSQLETAFRAVNPAMLREEHVLLVDDVMTTGATLESAAAVLRAAGVRRVSAMVFAWTEPSFGKIGTDS